MNFLSPLLAGARGLRRLSPRLRLVWSGVRWFF